VPRIVVGVDGSDASAAALRWALRHAAASGSAVEAVTSWTLPVMGGYMEATIGFDPDVMRTEAIRTATESLQAAVDAVGIPAGKVDAKAEVAEGGAAHVLLELAKGADMIVIGARGRGAFAGALLGSVSQQVAHHTPCPLVIVPDRAADRADRPVTTIAVGVDGSPGARAALAWAVREAALVGATVRAVGAWQMPVYAFPPAVAIPGPDFDLSGPTAALIAEVVADVAPGTAVEPVVVNGPAALALLDEAETADLVVVGSRGTGGFAGLLLGSVSQQLAAHSPAPVAIVPEPPEP
jgi:nucleotide-binding universal stress UspA family protein